MTIYYATSLSKVVGQKKTKMPSGKPLGHFPNAVMQTQECRPPLGLSDFGAKWPEPP